MKFNIVHTNNYPTQYKFRQNFYHVATAGESVGAHIIHKFAQKYGFKGSWDGVGKLVKGAILKNEVKNDRCANAKDCYHTLNRDLTKDGSEESNQKWIKWEATEDERIV